MAFVGYEQVTTTVAVKTAAALTIPANAHGAELQVDTQPMCYTMDGATDPATGAGMVMAVADPPKYFNIDDIRNLRFIRNAGGDGNLNLHYSAGRDV
jgi:hypothetical protein